MYYPDRIVLQAKLTDPPTALIFYEYFLTLGDEVRHMWGRPCSPFSLLFYVNRYSVMIGAVFLLLMKTQTPLTLPVGSY